MSNASGSRLKVAFLPHWEENPYQDLLARELGLLGLDIELLPRRTWFLPALRRGRRTDILHLHSPDQLFLYSRNALFAMTKLAAVVMQLVFARSSGTRIVWTAHDLGNHEGLFPRLDRLGIRCVARLAEAIFVHTEATRPRLMIEARLAEQAKIHVVTQGHYRDWYPDAISRASARAALGLGASDFALLFFGNLRAYKGVPELVNAVRQLPDRHLRLIIAGKPFSSALTEDIEGAIGTDSRISFEPKQVAADRVQVYMNGCDAVVAPFRKTVTSASVILAMSFGKPCIAPRMGDLGSVLDGAGPLLYDPQAPGGLLEAIRFALSHRSDLAQVGEQNRRRATEWNWAEAAKATLRVYLKCVNR